MKKTFFYTDMADECAVNAKNKINYDLRTKKIGDYISVSSLTVKNDSDAKSLGRAKGRYITVDYTGGYSDLGEKAIVKVLRDELTDLTTTKIKNKPKVLVVGLGNRLITADALGSQTVDRLAITGNRNKSADVSAIATGVYGMTGIESLDIVCGVAEKISANLIVIIDTLATSRTGRLMRSFQITDAGLQPGSASGTGRQRIDFQSTGKPVIAIGVPICIYAHSLIYDSIDKTFKSDNVTASFRYRVCEEILGLENLSMILTPKDVDGGVKMCAKVIAEAINKCFNLQ